MRNLERTLFTRIAKPLKASSTIELAMLMPIILLVFTGIIFMGFYYHDKNVLYGNVYEVGSIYVQEKRGIEEVNISELGDFIEENIEKKLLLFKEVNYEIRELNTSVIIDLSAKRGYMKLAVEKQYSVNHVEDIIRRIYAS